MRDLGAIRIDALVLGEKANTRNAETVDFLLLLFGDVALEPDEPLARGQPLAQLARVEIGQHRGEQFHRFVDINDLARLAEQRGCLDIGG
jgi:hypothetical protein